MSESQDEIEARVSAKFGEKSVDCVEGPANVDTYQIARVWTKDSGGEHHAHYHVRSGPRVQIFRNFSPFAVWLDKQFDRDAALDRRLKIIRTFVASAVVLVTLGILASAMQRAPDPSKFIPYMLTAVVGTGAGFLFGTGVRRLTRSR